MAIIASGVAIWSLLYVAPPTPRPTTRVVIPLSATEPLEVDRKPRLFLQTPFNEGAPVFSPDGQRFVMIQESEEQQEAATQINVVLNWF